MNRFGKVTAPLQPFKNPRCRYRGFPSSALAIYDPLEVRSAAQGRSSNEEAETDAEGRYSFGDAMRSSYWFRWLRNLA